jgi:hypothetical protein
VEIVVAPSINFVKNGVLIGSVANLGRRLGGVSTGRNLNRSLGIPIATIGVIGTPQMVFTNPIMVIHVNRTTNQPPMSSIVVGRYIITNVGNLRT